MESNSAPLRSGKRCGHGFARVSFPTEAVARSSKRRNVASALPLSQQPSQTGNVSPNPGAILSFSRMPAPEHLDWIAWHRCCYTIGNSGFIPFIPCGSGGLIVRRPHLFHPETRFRPVGTCQRASLFARGRPLCLETWEAAGCGKAECGTAADSTIPNSPFRLANSPRCPVERMENRVSPTRIAAPTVT